VQPTRAPFFGGRAILLLRGREALVARRRRSRRRKSSRSDQHCWGIRIFRFKRCSRSRFYGFYCRDCIWQPMLAVTVMIGLLIVIPDGRWRDLIRPVAPGLAELGQGEADQVTNGTDFKGGGKDKPSPLDLPPEPEEPLVEITPRF